MWRAADADTSKHEGGNAHGGRHLRAGGKRSHLSRRGPPSCTEDPGHRRPTRGERGFSDTGRVVRLRRRVRDRWGAAQESLFIEPRRGSASDPVELRTRGARLLLSFLWIQAAGFVVYLAVSTWVMPSAFLRYGAQTAFGWTVIVVLAWATRRGWVALAATGYLGCGWLLLTLSAWTAGGLGGSSHAGVPGAGHRLRAAARHAGDGAHRGGGAAHRARAGGGRDAGVCCRRRRSTTRRWPPGRTSPSTRG